ncbi:MAG: T9SS type A sorting domain-containing protein, partial [Prolixibacteraceae bacterium]|nr:T9SS type A sorting domain-containing protein [Prolixibacteraceae bacterium]
GSSGTVFLISPEMQNPINSLYLNFRAKYSSSSGSLNIGTVYSPDDTESFSLIKSVPLTTEFEYYQIILDDYEGSDKYIAISSSQVNALIDDLTVDFIPVCVMPLNLDGDVIASTSASLTWDAGNDETQWELAYGSPGFDPDTEGTKIDDISATAYTITGLLPGSRVEAYVRSDCGVGDYSEWSLPFYFETLCDILNLPFNEGFIDPSEPLCWVDDNNYWDLASNSNNAGGIAPYEAYYQRRSLSGISRLVTPQINTSGKQEVILSFKSKMVDYTLGSYQATITVQTQHETASWWVTENWEMDVKTGSNEQLDVSLSIPTYGSDYLKIAFCIMGDHMALENWSIDDVSVAEVTSCFTPLNVVAGNATAESIDLSWTQPGDESSWDIEYGPVGFAQGEGTLIEAVGVNPYSLTGLESSSTYEVYVRAGCGEGQYSFWSESTVFQTICDQVYDLPFAEAFDETEMPVCWREQLDDPSQSGDFESWIVEAYDDAGGTPNQLALYACAYNGISRLIMPQLNTAGISNVIFSFDTYIDDSEALPLDFKTQMSVDGENWTDIDGWGYNTENGIFGPQNVSVEITGLSSEVLFLAFVVDGDHENFYFWSIDNVEVESNLVPEDLEVISFNAECFNALNNISVAGNSNSVLIPDGESATFIAGQSIRFLPGFHAEAGSYVDAHITTDGIFCNSLAESSIVLLEPDEKSEELDAQEENYMSPFIDAFDVKIYPNPNNGRFTIEIYNSTDERASLFVYSLNGLMLYRSETGKSQDVNLPYLRAGLYMVRVESGGERIIKKMVVN